jgi:hypothetical protein
VPVYPVIPAGTQIDAAMIQSLEEMFAFKSANTDRASTTTLADDPDLTFQLEANAVYRVMFIMHYAALSAAEIKTQWTTPTGATGNRSAVGAPSGTTDATAAPTMRLGVHNFTTTITYGTRSSATNLCYALEESIVTTTNSGTCALQWAQNASNATATRMGSGSYAYAMRLA